MGEWSRSVVDVRGYGVAVSEAGDGAPVLLLDDVLGPYGRDAFAQALSARHRVSIPTHPGHDGSPLPEWLDNVSDLANFYLDYLAARGLRGVPLVGCGLGGWIAADLATRDSARLASLTLVAAGGLRLSGVPQCDIFLGGDEEVLRKIIHDRALADRVAAETITPDTEDTRLQNQQFAARLMWQPRLHDPNLRKWLHRIDAPTLVVWGANDALYPAPYGEAWRDAIPGARLEVISDCGHLPRVEKPGTLAELVTAFIAKQRVAA